MCFLLFLLGLILGMIFSLIIYMRELKKYTKLVNFLFDFKNREDMEKINGYSSF
jgi:hypothetical protein